jgi:hypothetical protein
MGAFIDVDLILGHIRTGGIPLSFRPGDIELIAATALEGCLGDAKRFSLVRCILLGDTELGLRTAQQEIMQGDLGPQREQEGVPLSRYGLLSGPRRFDRVANPSKEIEFPGGVETDFMQVVISPTIKSGATTGSLDIGVGSPTRGYGSEIEPSGGPE